MCGFVGVFGRIPEPELTKALVTDALQHFRFRGPDKSEIESSSHCIVGFNRLAINDLASGRQPRIHQMTRGGHLLAVMNGEIFNYRELDQQYLPGPNRRDEIGVVCGLYERYGRQFVELLNGQFSIAISDESEGALHLVRDPFGIRPLFCSVATDRNQLIFGQDLSSLWQLGVSKIPDSSQLARMHLTWSTSRNRTIWKSIDQVKPGSIETYKIESTNGVQKVGELEYWDWAKMIGGQQRSRRRMTRADCEEFREQLQAAVRRQTMSEVGYAAYVSGGIDSSALAFELAATNPKLQTFSVTFEDSAYDESPRQRELNKQLGLTCKSVSVDDAAIADNFADVVRIVGQPFFRTAPVPMYLLSRAVRQEGHRVVLSGEGADELLLGYDIFREYACVNFVQERPESRWRYRVFDNLYSYLPQFQDPRYRRLAIDTLMRQGEFGVLNPLKSRLSNNLRTLTTFNESDLLCRTVVPELIGEFEHYRDSSELDDLDLIQLFEIGNLLSGYLLSAQGDRAAMGNSVEGRYPYLDLEFVKYSFSIPRSFKLQGTNFKRILRESYQDLLPKSIIESPKIAYQAPEARTLLRSVRYQSALEDSTNELWSIYDRQAVSRVARRLSNAKSHSRGSFGDNLSIVMACGLSDLLESK